MKKHIRTLAYAGLLGAALSGTAYGMGPAMIGIMGGMMMGMGGMSMMGTMNSGDGQHQAGSQEGTHRSTDQPAASTPMGGDSRSPEGDGKLPRRMDGNAP